MISYIISIKKSPSEFLPKVHKHLYILCMRGSGIENIIDLQIKRHRIILIKTNQVSMIYWKSKENEWGKLMSFT